MNKYDELSNEYLQLLNSLFLIGNHQVGEKVTESNKWIIEVEALVAKLFYHLGTILNLRNGTSIQLPNDQSGDYIDHSSISVIVRAAFETYLTFYYLFCDIAINEDTQQLRYFSWILRGFLDWQNFRVVSKESLLKLEKEKEEMEKIIEKIELNPTYRKLNNKTKNMFLKGKWREKYYWSGLAKIAGFNELIFKDTYSYLCSYSHSGSLSAFQISDASTQRLQFDLTKISMHYGLIIMSHFIKSYTKLFPESKKALEKEKQSEFLLEKWYVTWHEEAFLNPFT